ncbi:hypothetical protein CUZ56_01766 [Saezia sanguinis]|uniref:Uncharacterized protein n=1 Tax=Saezia sanguinis TaxID=1965230 RepID=A0A433SCS8_9BURK|nr:hypothetical protein [Saezia sanguinis]RUS66486.1 hypothetical protein CUZ56_01766 [Saezia sanguinis]
MKNNTAMPIKMTLAMTGALYGLLLGAAVSAQPASQTAPHVEPAASAAAHTPTHTPAHAVTLYGLTLGEVVPQLPECHPDVAFGRIGDDICITYAEGFYSTVDPHLKYGTADEVVIWFPNAMQINGYPQNVVVGTDKDDRMVYFSIRAYGHGEITTGIYPELTQQDQQRYMVMFKEQLGEPDVYIIRTRGEDRSMEAMMRDIAPDGIPSAMWDVAANGSVIAVWLKKDVWAKYVGQYDESDYGRIEIGLRSMFADGQVPNK